MDEEDFIPIEALSAYSLYEVQRSLNEFEKSITEAKSPWDFLDPNGIFGSGAAKRKKYERGDDWDLQDEYRYLLLEEGFEPTSGITAEAEGKSDKVATDADADRIDQAYAEGIGRVNQALDDATLGEDITNVPPVNPTDVTVDAEPVEISNPEEYTGKLGGINSYKRSLPTTMRTIKNNSINI